MLHLQVSIDKNSGFCFGVIYAIDMAEQILAEKDYLYCLGDIVHNDEEVKRLQQLGLIIIDHERFNELRNEEVLIRAHGEPPSTYQIALNNNLKLMDASCPVVLKLQNRIKKSYDSGKEIYIFGKERHAEVIGLLGQTGNHAIVFEKYDELNAHTLPAEITLYSQTTKSTTELYHVKNRLESRGIKVDLKDTICRQVSNRDEELRGFASRFNVVLFVSGSKSSNGKMLFTACKEANPATYFVSSPDDIDNSWFKGKEQVGICGATSTPMWLMENVRDKLLKI
ncbi:4-hydroxy-3-methylbut-2-enyl diphosphate reductase [Mucilaginibacter sp.]|uniref:4-hydroxy-3-methylbut-2-enyl diphosphate reductase n=1 Tax=Mucilaginibacter sp. TaxID=1882438 RepID=UPI0025DE1A6B|nr:4-hydroxy-3-methylbut-2-enyl diphosphate reductase [Mucilaginibacter sp.]